MGSNLNLKILILIKGVLEALKEKQTNVAPNARIETYRIDQGKYQKISASKTADLKNSRKSRNQYLGLEKLKKKSEISVLGLEKL